MEQSLLHFRAEASDRAMTISAAPKSAVALEHSARSTWERLRAIVAQESNLPIYYVIPALDWRMIDASQMNMGTIAEVIRDEFGVAISLRDVYRLPNFGALAAHIDQEIEKQGGSGDVIRSPDDRASLDDEGPARAGQFGQRA